MSSIGMMGANMLQSLLAHTTQSKSQKFKQDFQQLGQDLQFLDRQNLNRARLSDHLRVGI